MAVGRGEPAAGRACSRPASCSGPGSTPAGGSAAPTSARACSPPTIRPKPTALAAELDALNAERQDGGGRRARRGASPPIERDGNLDPDAPAHRGRRRRLAPGRDRHRRQPAARDAIAGRWSSSASTGPADIGKGSGRSQPGVNLGARGAGRLRRGPAAGRRRPRHGGGPDHPPRRHPRIPRLSLRAPRGARWPTPRRRTRWTSTPWSAPGSAPQSPGRCSRAGALRPRQPRAVFALADVQVESAGAGARRPRPRLPCATPPAARLRAVAWRAGETPLGGRLLAGGGSLHVAGVLKPDD